MLLQYFHCHMVMKSCKSWILHYNYTPASKKRGNTVLALSASPSVRNIYFLQIFSGIIYLKFGVQAKLSPIPHLPISHLCITYLPFNDLYVINFST